MMRRQLLKSMLVAGTIPSFPITVRRAAARDGGTVEVPFYLFAAFTTVPLTWKPAPVVVLNEWLPDATMQALFVEMNQSEVACILKRNGDRHIR